MANSRSFITAYNFGILTTYRFHFTDFTCAGVLRAIPLVHHIVLTYDIACQYSVNFHLCCLEPQFALECWDPIQAAVGRIKMFIPKLHLKGHKEDYQYHWSLNFSSCSGQTHGERIEGAWAEQKQGGSMTKEMNVGHRHDILNDFKNFWKWTRVQKMRK